MNKKIGLFIRQLRKEVNMTQEQLAEKLGVSNRSVSRWENGSTMPDIQLMKCICDLFQITVSELINAQRQDISTDRENALEKIEIRAKGALEAIIKLSEYEMKQKAKAMTFYFTIGLVFLGIIVFQSLCLTLGFIEVAFLNKIQTVVFLMLGFTAEIAGLHFNAKFQNIPVGDIDIFLQDEDVIKLKTADEMIRFARKNQYQIFKQHKQAFKEISSKLNNDEYAIFTMLCEEYYINNSPGPWHVAVAVTNRRFFLSGETVSGRIFTRYVIDIWDLTEIKSIYPENQDIVIETTKEKLKLRGKEIDRLKTGLEKCLKQGR